MIKRMFNIALTDAIAIGALCISILTLIIQIRTERASRRRSLFEETFRKYLVNDIPQARNEVEIVNGRWMTKKLQMALSQLRRDMLYFKFYNSSFYNRINAIILKIDDLVVEANNDSDKSARLPRNLDYHINLLYDEITSVYFSGTI